MNKTLTLAVSMLAMFLVLFFTTAQAAGEHDEHGAEHAAEQPEGPHGGRLLTEADFAVEVTLFETGIPPEMRLYAFVNDKQVAPDELTASVTLHRLDGQQDNIRFSPEQDYLVGDISIAEPHSFSVDITVNYQDRQYHWHYDNFEGRVELNERILPLTGIDTAIAKAQVLTQKTHLFGVISSPPTAQFQVKVPYPGTLTEVLVQQGDLVRKGQRIASIRNAATFKQYDIVSPANGIITDRFFNSNELIREEVLFTLVDYSEVYVELSAFPNDIAQLRVGMPVSVFSLHHGQSAKSSISYIAPQMTEGHIARMRAVIDNSSGYWRPGMHIKAEVLTATIPVELAVQKQAIQRYRDMPVVFARYGNIFEVRMLQFGREDDEYIEVTAGLKPGTEYATVNSFVLKADVLKSGASHHH
ncbi:efflux RND transporter periplasmic adaptor subunit [Arsukibacterium sp.]|uniref:efflux RND transporter periplasmic adaptor subunit n=1 Tax=Arsukibacterium sp. TaxID=1977258 RepID=UPI00299DEBCE|nr:efflux RND transporter periplasmic adaptor subunit [Arsukibacterium sp.]MDX1536156.1 efflux RND transporter periplasmic adaptor subunit [Arsukibacterium sp.]